MKRSLIALLVAAAVGLNCYGSFTLTKKIYKWNGTVGDKFVNSAVMWVLCIIPVYEACTFIDGVVLNTIEFWTGSNPVALKQDTMTEQTVAANGKTYQVLAGQNRLVVTETSGPDQGRTVTLNYSATERSWYLGDQKLVTLDDELGTVATLYYPDGRVETGFLEGK